MDHRLFAVDILARLHCVHGDLLVPMVGCADDDGINIFALQNLGVIAGGKDVVAPDFLAVLKPAVVAIRHGNELHPGNLDCDFGISLALTTGADQARSGCGRWPQPVWPARIAASASKCVLDPSNVSAVAAAPATLRKLLRFNSCTVVLTPWKLSAVCNHTASCLKRYCWLAPSAATF